MGLDEAQPPPEFARLGIVQSRSGAERLRTLEQHLVQHPRRKAGVNWGRYTWLAPPVLAGLGLVAAWRHQRTRERILGALFSGGMWVLKRHFSGGGVQKGVDPTKLLTDAESSTYYLMLELGEEIQKALPVEELKSKLLPENRKKLTKDELKSVWADLVVYTMTRMVVGSYVLGVAHFVSTSVHSLSPRESLETAFPHAHQASLINDDLPLSLNLAELIRSATASCRESLRSRSLTDIKAQATFTDISQVLSETSATVSHHLGLTKSQDVTCHEALFGEEVQNERDILKKLRDLLETPSGKDLLTTTVDCFGGILERHVKDARGDLGCEGDEVKVAMVKLNPKLTNELVRVTEDSNEYLLSLRVWGREGEKKKEKKNLQSVTDAGESSWSSFFLDLNALVEASPQAAKTSLAGAPLKVGGVWA